MPPSVQRSNAKHYKSNAITEVKEFEGPHLMIAAQGWETIADAALDWAVANAREHLHTRRELGQRQRTDDDEKIADPS